MQSIENILSSDKNFTVLSDFLAVQERDRLVAILEQVLEGDAGQVNGKRFEDWSRLVKPLIVKELQDAQEYFGFKDFPQRFNINSFLEAYYKSLSAS